MASNGSPSAQDNNHWPAASRKYLDSIGKLSQRFPNLAILKKTLEMAQPHLRGRVVVLEFQMELSNQQSSPSLGFAPTYTIRHRDIESPNALLDYLREAEKTRFGHGNGPMQLSRLFLVEDLIPSYVNILGEHFSIDPAFFAGHLTLASWHTITDRGGEGSTLPSARVSALNQQSHFWTLLFYEVLVFRHPEMLPRSDNIFRNTNVFRRVQLGKAAVEGVECGIAHSNASFWSKSRDKPIGKVSSTGWDGMFYSGSRSVLISMLKGSLADTIPVVMLEHRSVPVAVMLLDPSAVKVVSGTFPLTRYPLPQQTQPILYQAGYVDFRPTFAANSNEHNYTSPPRTSIFDDVLFYWTSESHGGIARAIMDPTGRHAAVFLKQIVSSNWVLLNELLKQTISRLEYELEEHHMLANNAVTQRHTDPEAAIAQPLEILERNLMESHMWRRRCALYHGQMQNNCRALGIGLEAKAGTDSTRTDFIFIMEHLSGWKQRAEALVSVSMSQLSILEGRRSLFEARGVKRLTVLGLLFVPLSLVAAILSMGDPFRPGGTYFWVFFVVGLPMVIFMFAVTFGNNGISSYLAGLGGHMVSLVQRGKIAIITQKDTLPSSETKPMGAATGNEIMSEDTDKILTTIQSRPLPARKTAEMGSLIETPTLKAAGIVMPKTVPQTYQNPRRNSVHNIYRESPSVQLWLR